MLVQRISFVQEELGIGKDATIDFNNYLREVCAADLLANPVLIGGPNMTVEADESLFSRRKNNQGCVLPQQWVFGGWCRQTKESFMYAVPDRSAATLLPIIQASIRPGSTIISDLWRAYGGIAAMQGMGFNHLTVNHSINFVDPQTGAHTQNVERSWNQRKKGIKDITAHIVTCLIHIYANRCGEQRHQNLNLFDHILANIAAY